MKSNKHYSTIKYVSGCCWIITAVCGYFNNRVADAIRTVLPLALLIFVLTYAVITKENPRDSEKMIAAAKAKAASVIFYACCVMAVFTPVIYLVFDGSEWNWMLIMTYTFFIMLGIIDISTAVAFSKLRKRKPSKKKMM